MKLNCLLIALVVFSVNVFSQINFSAKTDYSALSFTSDIKIADINNDFKLDLVITGQGSSQIGVFTGTGTGGFGTMKVFSSTPISNPISLVIGDFNSDSFKDLAVMSNSFSSFGVFTGTGIGGFTYSNSYTNANGSYDASLTDINNDGLLDIVSSNLSGVGSVTVLTGTGVGTFPSVKTYTAAYSRGLAFADFNNDLINDAVVGRSLGGGINVLLGNTLSGFDFPVFTSSTNVFATSTGDYNKDGFIDVAATGGGSTMFVFTGDGTGAMGSPQNYPIGDYGISLVSIDFDLDGNLDIAVANQNSSNVTVFKGLGNGNFQSVLTLTSGLVPTRIQSADFNGDGKPDLVVANSLSSISVFLNLSTGSSLVSSATISGQGGISQITTNGGNLQMQAFYAPSNATNTVVVWSASPSSVATINSSGLLTAVANGVVTVTGTYGLVSASTLITVNVITLPTTFSGYPIQITNGQVTAMAINTTTGIMYFGGLFTHINVSVTGSFASINESGGLAEEGWPNIANDVNVIVPDGLGGWFVGGDIYQADGIPRSKLAHINAAKQVTSWNPPDANGNIEAMILVGNTLYVSGGFTNLGGVTRRGLAAIDAITGTVTGFNSDPAYTQSGQITSMAVSGSLLFVGGNISTIMGVPRNDLAAIDLNTGSVTGWNPSPNNNVTALVANSTHLYVGGQFTIIAGKTQAYLACFDLATGSVTGWNPNPSRSIQALALSGNRIYVAGGSFTVIGGQSRYSGLAALNITGTGTAIASWAPSNFMGFDNWGIYSLAVNGNAVYAGGRFKAFNGIDRNGLAAFDLTTGTLLGWNPNTNKKNAGSDRFIWIHSVVLSGNKVFVGGDFQTVGGAPRSQLAAIDINTGKETSWNPSADGYAEKIVLSGNTVYVGGDFTTVGGVSRNHLAAIDAMSGTTTSWNPNANAIVKGIEVIGNIVYVGGQFTSISGMARNRLAAIDATTGLATTWYPSTNGSMEIRTLKTNNGIMYVGGEFANIGGMPRSNLAAIDIVSGSITGWAPNSYPANRRVNTIDISGNTVYIGGDFTTVSGVRRNRLAAVDISTGIANSWDPNADDQVFEILVKNNLIYATGAFQRIGTPIRRYLAAMDATTGALTNWDPSPTSTNVINSNRIIAYQDKVYIAGNGGNSNVINTIAGNWLGKTNDFLVRQDGSGPANAVLVTSSTIAGAGNASSVTIGASLQMIATYLPANATNTTPIWSVAPSNRALINGQGLLTGVSVGLVTVTGSFGSVFAIKTISIIGVQGIPVTSATISGNGIQIITVGGTLQLTSSYSPLNANTNTIPSWNSSNNSFATVNSSGLVTALDQGVVTITSSFGAISGKYVVSIVGIPKENQSLFFSNLPSNLTYGDPSFALNATVNSGLPIVFISDNPKIASIQGSTVIITGGGIVNITASVTGNATYNSASIVQQLLINKVELTVIGINATKYYGQPYTQSFVFQIGGFINGDTYNAIDTLPIGISSTTLLSDAGEYPITFTGAKDNAYSFNYVNSGKLTILKAPQVLTGFGSTAIVKVGETITLTGTSQSGLPITSTVNDPAIATVNGLALTGLAEGITSVNIVQNGNVNYQSSAPISITLISTTTGVSSANLFGIIGKTVVAAGTETTYKVPEKPGYTYEWSYSGAGVVLLDTTGAEIRVLFTSSATQGSIVATIKDPLGNVSKIDFINVTVNGSGVANQSKDLNDLNCEAVLSDCELNYINLFSIKDLKNLNSGCSKSGYGDFTSTGKIDTLRMGDKYAINIEGIVETDGKSYFGAWLDYDNNGNFNDPDDYINVSFESATSYTIPNVIIKNQKEYEGNRRLRVAMRTSARFLNTSACLEEGEKGETEDYLVYIKAQDALEASPIITPNEDGKNDIFIVRGIDPRFENKLTILDRQGIPQFEITNYQNNWRGTQKDLNGKPLEEGTYFYFFNNGERQIKGFVEVKRE